MNRTLLDCPHFDGIETREIFTRRDFADIFWGGILMSAFNLEGIAYMECGDFENPTQLTWGLMQWKLGLKILSSENRQTAQW